MQMSSKCPCIKQYYVHNITINMHMYTCNEYQQKHTHLNTSYVLLLALVLGPGSCSLDRYGRRRGGNRLSLGDFTKYGGVGDNLGLARILTAEVECFLGLPRRFLAFCTSIGLWENNVTLRVLYTATHMHYYGMQLKPLSDKNCGLLQTT